MSVAGKKHEDWIAQTFCDFGEPRRRTTISNHFSIDAAGRQFKRINKIYGANGWRCWQEDRAGNVINGVKPWHDLAE